MKLLHPLLEPLKGSISSSRYARCVRGTPCPSLKSIYLNDPLPCRYNPEVGDLVIGRITEVRVLLMLVSAGHTERRRYNREGGRLMPTLDRMPFSCSRRLISPEESRWIYSTIKRRFYLLTVVGLYGF